MDTLKASRRDAATGSRSRSALESGSLLRTCVWEDEEECRCARVEAAGTSGMTDTRVQISTPDRPRVCVVADWLLYPETCYGGRLGRSVGGP